ncbi:MAG: hypothetical protein Q8N30_01490 [Methylococcales bacterium]|nr:hypothetical protein [Methylococcales bacterium]
MKVVDSGRHRPVLAVATMRGSWASAMATATTAVRAAPTLCDLCAVDSTIGWAEVRSPSIANHAITSSAHSIALGF